MNHKKDPRPIKFYYYTFATPIGVKQGVFSGPEFEVETMHQLINSSKFSPAIINFWSEVSQVEFNKILARVDRDEKIRQEVKKKNESDKNTN